METIAVFSGLVEGYNVLSASSFVDFCLFTALLKLCMDASIKQPFSLPFRLLFADFSLTFKVKYLSNCIV